MIYKQFGGAVVEHCASTLEVQCLNLMKALPTHTPNFTMPTGCHGSHRLGHVAFPNWTKKKTDKNKIFVIKSLAHKNAQSFPVTCLVNVQTADLQLATQNFRILVFFQISRNGILGAYDIGFELNELHWIQGDEIFVLIPISTCFENFEI